MMMGTMIMMRAAMIMMMTMKIMMKATLILMMEIMIMIMAKMNMMVAAMIMMMATSMKVQYLCSEAGSSPGYQCICLSVYLLHISYVCFANIIKSLIYYKWYSLKTSFCSLFSFENFCSSSFVFYRGSLYIGKNTNPFFVFASLRCLHWTPVTGALEYRACTFTGLNFSPVHEFHSSFSIFTQFSSRLRLTQLVVSRHWAPAPFIRGSFSCLAAVAKFTPIHFSNFLSPAVSTMSWAFKVGNPST